MGVPVHGLEKPQRRRKENSSIIPIAELERGTRLRYIEGGLSRRKPLEERARSIETERMIEQGFFYFPKFDGKHVPGYGYLIPERIQLPGGRILDIDSQLKPEALSDKKPNAVKAWKWYNEHLKDMPEEKRRKYFPDHHPSGQEERLLDQRHCEQNYGRIRRTRAADPFFSRNDRNGKITHKNSQNGYT